MTQKQMTQFMRQCSELNSGRVITVDMHSIARKFFIFGSAFNYTDQASPLVSSIDPIPLNSLFVHSCWKGRDTFFINRANGKPWNDTTSVNRTGPGSTDAELGRRSPQTIHEWGEPVANRQSGRPQDSTRDRSAGPPDEPTVVEQEFTYQRTDPSRYKDPVYEVPPLTGRRVNASRYPMR